MEKLVIEIKKSKAFVNDRFWGKKSKNQDLGDLLLNILFYNNKKGDKKIKIIVDGVNETSKFKKDVKKEYQNIPNTELRDSFYLYCNIK